MQPISLGVVRVKTPCTVPWESMRGDDRTRFCPECNLHVHNVSSLTYDEAMELVARTEGRLCVSYFERPDGTILTEKCPRALRAIRNSGRWLWARVAGWCGLGLAAAAGCIQRLGIVDCDPPNRAAATAPSTRDAATATGHDERVFGGTDEARLEKFKGMEKRKIALLKAKADQCAMAQNYAEAISLLQKVVAIDPNDQTAQWKLALLSDNSPTCGKQ